MPVEVGHRVPDVTLVSPERKGVTLHSLLGKVTVLAFFPGAFTATCTKEMCAFRDGLGRLAALHAQVVGISVDSPFAQKAFADQHGLNFPLFSDYNRHAVKAFGVEDPNFANGLLAGVAKRSVFVLDREGTVTYKWVSDIPSVEPDYDAVVEAVGKVGHRS